MAVLLAGAWAEHHSGVGTRAPGAGMQEPVELGLQDGPKGCEEGLGSLSWVGQWQCGCLSSWYLLLLLY